MCVLQAGPDKSVNCYSSKFFGENDIFFANLQLQKFVVSIINTFDRTLTV